MRLPRTMGQMLVGLLVADFLTAAAHWFEDTYLPYSSAPGLLGNISRDNEMHHFIPYSITAGSWWDTCKVSAWLVSGLALATAALAPAWAWRHRVALGTAAVAMTLSNLVHRFQHERDCTRPAVVTLLQRAGVLCSRDQHAVHHRLTSVRYSVILGFTNAVYDGLGVWRLFERVLASFGVLPHARKPGVGDYKALHDEWLETNMAKDCPDALTPERLEGYYGVLAQAHRKGWLPRGGE